MHGLSTAVDAISYLEGIPDIDLPQLLSKNKKQSQPQPFCQTLYKMVSASSKPKKSF
jgi:hypothetical protein